jgi:hypothetical protein
MARPAGTIRFSDQIMFGKSGGGYWAPPFNKGHIMKPSLLSFSAAALVAVAAIAFASTPSRAEIDYPWCSMTPTSQSGIPACRYATLAQCEAFVAGLSGTCQRNSRIVWQEQQMQATKRGAR